MQKSALFLYTKKSPTYTDLLDENKQKIKKILNWDRYIDRAKFDPVSRNLDIQI